MSKVLRTAIIGMGGFAHTHHEKMLALEKKGRCKLICTCDPDMGAFKHSIESLDFKGRRVKTFGHYIDMLNACGDELDVVHIPTPIPLHAEMHRACVERGISVYLEKPPTVNYAELEDMIKTDKKAAKLTNVGFNFIVEDTRQKLKQRIISGEFGKTEKVYFYGMWPRATSYFTRSYWPGKLMLDGKLVLDSCMSNALAHYVHNSLFWAGQGELYSWAQIKGVEAEIYKANDIEALDMVFAVAQTKEGPDIRIAITHDCAGASDHLEWVDCEKAIIYYRTAGNWEIKWKDGSSEVGESSRSDFVEDNFSAYFDYVNGESDRPITRLTDCRPFVEFCGLVYIASGKLTRIPAEYITRHEAPNNAGVNVAVNGIEDIIHRFMQTGEYPSSQGAAWAHKGGTASPADLPKLPEVIKVMYELEGSK